MPIKTGKTKEPAIPTSIKPHPKILVSKDVYPYGARMKFISAPNDVKTPYMSPKIIATRMKFLF